VEDVQKARGRQEEDMEEVSRGTEKVCGFTYHPPLSITLKDPLNPCLILGLLIESSDWWFASTGIPLLAATLGPLANVSSIAALVTSWRAYVYIDGISVTDFEGAPFADPTWYEISPILV
jgi:hypothetical protein